MSDYNAAIVDLAANKLRKFARHKYEISSADAREAVLCVLRSLKRPEPDAAVAQDVVERAITVLREAYPDLFASPLGHVVRNVICDLASAGLLHAQDGGWRLVPVEPTKKMFAALMKNWKNTEAASIPIVQWALSSFVEDYKAMLAAAPVQGGE